jgi:tetratricopeptide (TPR) repeat protein
MQKQHILVITGAVALLLGLYFFGPTVAPTKKAQTPVSVDSGVAFTIEKYRAMALTQISPAKKAYADSIEIAYKNNQAEQASHEYLHKLSTFWKDSVGDPVLHYFYESQLAELDNTEKSLTFAAHSILGYLPFERSHDLQHWLADKGKELFEKALKINPANDSTVVGLGGCLMYGAHEGEGGNTMEGILKVREVAERDSNFIFAQYMLGVGGVISKQYDRAVIRFTKVVKAQPDNLEAMFKLAEAHELAGQKAEAISWYELIYKRVENVELKMELTKRIEALKKG